MKLSIQKRILAAVRELCDLTGQASDEESAKQMKLEKYVSVDHTPYYGGYRLVSISLETGKPSAAFGFGPNDPRLAANEFMIRLNGMITFYHFLNNRGMIKDKVEVQ